MEGDKWGLFLGYGGSSLVCFGGIEEKIEIIESFDIEFYISSWYCCEM